ncbi:MAG: HPr(Ser) kinase/phosphatase [Candidatus Cloacimonadota bacterium]|nr:HPr(Ser) kinase/phosphatase [Candidatus Cloacimonadota bacterium]
MKKLTVKHLFELKEKPLSLSLISRKNGMENIIETPFISKMGLSLSGFIETFHYERIQILGEVEIKYLLSIKSSEMYDQVEKIFSEFKIPCIIVSKNFTPPDELVFLADENNIPIIVSKLKTSELFHKLNSFLNNWFASQKTLNGTLVDVFGVGILITGKSGIGKSECALELVSRGHRFICDDMVFARKKSDIIMGEVNKNMGHFMEIRGIGLVDIETMYGVRSVRIQKRIETQVELVPWRPNMDYERIGLKERYSRILDVEIPITYLPVSPGKSIAVIIEVIAMNHMLKVYGYNAAEIFNQRLQTEIQRNKKTEDYLESDQE